MDKITGYKLKVVERAGDSMEGLLHRSNPWSGADCARQKCLLCETKRSHPKYENQSCRKRNVVYITLCETCRIEVDGKVEGDTEETRLYQYIGESSRSCYERGWELQADCDQSKPGSHMLKHIIDKHGGKQPGEVKFKMRAVKFHKSEFERQLQKAVMSCQEAAHPELKQ